MRYILWVVALLEASDVTNNGRHPGVFKELEILVLVFTSLSKRRSAQKE